MPDDSLTDALRSSETSDVYFNYVVIFKDHEGWNIPIECASDFNRIFMQSSSATTFINQPHIREAVMLWIGIKNHGKPRGLQYENAGMRFEVYRWTWRPSFEPPKKIVLLKTDRRGKTYRRKQMAKKQLARDDLIDQHTILKDDTDEPPGPVESGG